MRRRATAAALLALGVLAAGCAGADEQGTPSQQMTSWVKGTSFGATVTTLESDAAKATTELARGSTADIHTICGVFLVDVEQSNGVLPTPDQQSTNLLSSAYNSLLSAAYDCYDAPGSPVKREAFARTKARGLASLSEATARVEAVLGMSLGEVGGATEGVTGASGVTP